jgi:hypothetical protein
MALAATCATLAAPASAAADSFGPPQAFDLAVSPAQLYPIGGAAMNTARAIADRYWGADPCAGSVALTWVSTAPTVNAVSTWRNPTDLYTNPAQNFGCKVDFNELQGFDWPMLCAVFVHEFGHLAGHQHALDRSSAMFPFYTTPIAQCKTPEPVPPPSTPPQAATAAQALRPPRRPHRHHRHHAKRKHHRHKQRDADDA